MAATSYIIQAFDIISVVFLWTWWIFIIVGLFIMKKKYSNYPIDVVIIEKRGENLIKTNERAGRQVDKETQVSFYRLKKSKETMPVYNFEWMLHNSDKPMSIFEKIVAFLRPTIGTIFLFKYGSKQYKPINVTDKNSPIQLKEIRNPNGESVFTYQYNQFDPRWVLGVLDFEVVDWDNMNFMVQEQRASMMRRSGSLDWLKTLAVPAMLIAGTVIVALFILKFSAEAGATLKAGGGNPPAKSTESGGVISGAINNAVTPPGG